MPQLILMQLHRAPLLLPLLALVGVLLPLLGMSSYWLLLSLGAFLIALFYREWLILFCSLLVAAVGFTHLDGTLRHEKLLSEHMLAQESVALSGYLVRTSTNSAFLQLADSSLKVELRGEHLSGDVGDAIHCVGKPMPLEESTLVGTFDRAAWLQSQGVFLSVELFECRSSKGGWHWSQCYALSDALRAKALQYLMPLGTEGDPARQVLCALLLGERRAAEPETLEAFQWSGTLHAFAVSGLHVGIVAALLWGLFHLLRLSPRLSQVLILLLLACYIFMTGMAVSSLRAYLIIFLVMLGMMKRRQVMMVNIFCAVALLVLLFAPRHLTQPGFLLSFAVYASICLASWLSRKERAWFGPDEYLPESLYETRHRLMRVGDAFVRGLVIVSMSAYLAALPITAAHFGSYNSYGVLANICIAPLLPFCMGLGLFSFLPYVGAYLLPLALKMSGLLLAICSFFAGLPASHVSTVIPQPDSTYACVGLRFEQSATLLGNPGLVISSANEQTARWSICPAFSASGMKGALFLQQPRFSKEEAGAYMKRFWSVMHFTEASDKVMTYHYGENAYTIYPAVVEMKKPRIRDSFPLIHWRHLKGSLLYIGDASASSFYSWKAQGADLRADLAIIGFNDKQPVIDAEALQELGIREIILLPNAPSYLYDESDWLRLRQLHENELIQNQLDKQENHEGEVKKDAD